jgi:hypothetical protein
MIYYIGIVIAFLLVVYFPRKKNKEAEGNRWLDYRDVVDKYVYAMGLGTDGIAKKSSKLKHSKAEIAKAFEEFVSDHSSTYSDEQYGSYLLVFYHLDSFVEDELAQSINAWHIASPIATDIDNQNHIDYLKQFGKDMTKRTQQFDSYVELRKYNLRYLSK